MLYAWGYGEDGATGLDATAWRPRRVELVQGVCTDISAGGAHSLVLVRGAVHALGTTLNGRAGVPCGNPPVERAVFDCVRGLPNDIIRVAAGGEHSLCLTASGEVYAWGRGGRAGQRSPRDVFACVLLSCSLPHTGAPSAIASRRWRADRLDPMASGALILPPRTPSTRHRGDGVVG